MIASLFVTGTDTGVGKTWVSAALLRHLVTQGRRAVGMKPVMSGAADDARSDVAVLRAAGNVTATPAFMNPYAFTPAIAPHVAAREAGVVLDLEHLAVAFGNLAKLAEVVIVEGAGGALVPLDARHDMLD
ncbi:MAG: dethiobiotin synthase, partial [Pseudomonadota bacterium]|nr:dethiobiotin synthase [Pseudomonadota bacterium]